MNLTPVLVRGKRKAPVRDSPDQPLRKKPMKSLSAVLASRRRATIETLPAETLELIFLYSQNLALPRASGIVGRKLSARSTFIRLFIQAFCDTWNQGFGLPLRRSNGEKIWCRQKLSRAGHGPFPRAGRECHGGNPVLQSAVLNLPQVDIDLILQAQHIWASACARDRSYGHTPVMSGLLEQDPHDPDADFHCFDARECFEADYQQALVIPLVGFANLPWAYQDVHPSTRLPTSLLTGPWDDEKMRRLFWLRRGGAMTKDHDFGRIPWEVRSECLQNMAFGGPKPNALAFNCLVDKFLVRNLPSLVVHKHMTDIDQRYISQRDSDASLMVLRAMWRTLELAMLLRPDPGRETLPVKTKQPMAIQGDLGRVAAECVRLAVARHYDARGVELTDRMTGLLKEASGGAYSEEDSESFDEDELEEDSGVDIGPSFSP
ncbi:hypothetical protein S7711_00528 [Stachybotrys chartarum IBT 7711]|uniref:Uncharacterized protein n=1 Tax=Stachybotrys chartarum (strain CBS 109288 / IBT 7711) TaxID=1280523 RepID=A0A084ATM0_STACB|nr:hypothetical protein S7711_00528 [Stachybotrys chartarum IBT 7711]